MSPITVAIPARNRTDLLKVAIESVLAQTFRDFEVVVSDNASVPEVRRIVEGFRDPRIRYLRHDRSIPMAENWQCSLLTPRTRYVAWLQDDDYWSPEHLANAMECLSSAPGATLYSCAIQHFHAGGNLELQLVQGWEHLDGPHAFTPHETLAIWLRRHSMQLSSTVFRRDALDGLSWGPANQLLPLDTQIIIMAALKGGWVYDPRCTAFYRYHPHNLSSTTPRIRVKYAAQGNYVLRVVASFAMHLGCLEEDRLVEELGAFSLAQRGGIVVGLAALDAPEELKRLARKLLTRYPDILLSTEASRHARIARDVGTWYLSVADLLNRARALWWPLGQQPVLAW